MMSDDEATIAVLKSMLNTAQENERTQRARADAAEKERDAAHHERREALRRSVPSSEVLR